ncbi:MAG: hypothetical protein GXX85_04135 [Ignavibacteria bacterium]|nr:hypothetical protein [Ignavibacteria bacterium]
MDNLNEIIDVDYDFLIEKYGFKKLNTNNKYTYVLKNSKIKIRFILDRADFFIDIMDNKNDEWIELYKLLIKLNVVDSGKIKPINKNKYLKSLLSKYINEILECYK